VYNVCAESAEVASRYYSALEVPSPSSGGGRE
jgi:hypothetical protein